MDIQKMQEENASLVLKRLSLEWPGISRAGQDLVYELEGEMGNQLVRSGEQNC